MNAPLPLSSVKKFVIANAFQCMALILCFVFGSTMIVNNQMQGEAMWFWYATLFHRGVRLYADMHFALQPFYVLEVNLWMRMFGQACLAVETLSLIHVLVYALGFAILARESSWSDWEKSVLILGGFVISVQCTAYRFDDYHVITDTFILYSMIGILIFIRTASSRIRAWIVSALAVLSGLAITTRLNDGAALLAATSFILLLSVRVRRWTFIGLFLVVALFTVAAVVTSTGDSLAAYATNSIFKAAGSKGGTGSVLLYPIEIFGNAMRMILARKAVLVMYCSIVLIGFFISRLWSRRVSAIISMQLAVAGLSFIFLPQGIKERILLGRLIDFLSYFTIVLAYILLPVVFMRYIRWRHKSNSAWGLPELLIIVIAAEVASASASTAAEPLNAFFSQMAILLILFAIIVGGDVKGGWVKGSLLTVVIILTITGITAKTKNPYSWNNYTSSPMFANRVLYHHPVYGVLYIDRDLLGLVEPICAQIGNGKESKELLSLPYSYPNYFCATPPWHGYVQTFFDTSTKPMIEGLIGELESNPPIWIVYQRQTKLLDDVSKLYNHGQPLAQRQMDTLIMSRIESRQWALVDRRKYLDGDGWLLIRTRP